MTTEERYSELRAVVRALCNVDNDYAREDNGIGWNGTDSRYGHALNDAAYWSPRMASIAYKMVQKYRAQVLQMAGVDVSTIPEPQEAVSAIVAQPRGIVEVAASRHLAFDGKVWAIEMPYDDFDLREKVKAIPGRLWDGTNRRWLFRDKAVERLDLVSLVRNFPMEMDWQASAVIDTLKAAAIERESRQQTLLELSGSYERYEIDVPGFRGHLLDTQTSGIQYVLQATEDGKGVLIGDKRGLGKTITVIGSLLVRNEFPCLISVPGGLMKLNWRKEIYRFSPDKMVYVLEGLRSRPLPLADVYLINHEILYAWWPRLADMGRQKIIKRFVIDEIHWFKTPGNFEAGRIDKETGELAEYTGIKRTAAAHQLAQAIGPVIGTSGTAITNRPKEIIEPLKLMHRLEDFGGFSNVVNYYGGHIQGRWGLADPDEPDPVRLAELNEKMRSVCYVRRTKRDKESPVERISVDIPLSNYEEYNRAERDLVTYLRQTKGFAAATMAERAYILVLLNTLRQITGRGKVKAALEWLDEWFEDSDVEDKLIIFGYHHEVLDALVKWAPQIAAKHRARSVHIIEKMAVNARFATMHVFQSDPTTRVVVCFSGASEGITLTAASSLLTMEFDWNPARHEQKEGRADREGQMADKVLSYYAVAENSIDGDMMERINKKAIVVNAVLDGIIPEENDPGMISAVLEGVMSRHTAAWA